jgi:hypothetical protein
VRWITSVGTRTLLSTWRTSISAFIRVSATAADGLAPIRRYAAHHCRKSGSCAIVGARSSIPTGPPHWSRSSSRNAWRCSAVGPHG